MFTPKGQADPDNQRPVDWSSTVSSTMCYVNECLHLFSQRTQLLEHCAIVWHLLHVSALSGHHVADVK